MIFDISYFEYPWALLLLLVVPMFIYWYTTSYSPRRLKVPITDSVFMQEHKNKFRSRLWMLPHISRWSAYILMVLAIARPVKIDETKTVETVGKDLMILLDVSASMDEKDIFPSRIEAGKLLISELLTENDMSRAGLILFSEEAFSYFPLTWDLSLIKEEIARISTDILPKDGTALGSAIALSITHFHDTQSENPIIVILSDGANNRGAIAPLTSARLASRADISIYFITIRSSTYASATFTEEDSMSLSYLAEITGGKTFFMEQPGTRKSILSEISELEKTETFEQIDKKTLERYPIFIQGALTLLIVTYVLLVLGINNPLEY